MDRETRWLIIEARWQQAIDRVSKFFDWQPEDTERLGYGLYFALLLPFLYFFLTGIIRIFGI